MTKTYDVSGRLEGKICLVAGASSGMGRQTALAAGYQGATVIAAARRIELCAEIAAEINGQGGTAIALAFDGTDPQSVQALLEDIGRRYGKLDCAFNNLGSTIGNSPVHETDLDRWHQALAINLSAPFYLMKYEVPLLRAAGGGSIINNSSTAGIKGIKDMADYSAAKWGLIGLTRSAALDYAADQIRINAIAPGIIETEKFETFKARMPTIFETMLETTPIGHFGKMQDIAATVTWLMSDEARYITGTTICVDGGRTAG